MNRNEIESFQALSRPEQIRQLVSDRIRNGYELSDFMNDYYTSAEDRAEFLTVYHEITGK